MRADAWPAIVRPLVATYGPQAVWDAGFEVFGYPADWIHEKPEADRLKNFLFRQSVSANQE